MSKKQFVQSITIQIPTWLQHILIAVIVSYRRLRYGYCFMHIKLTKGQYATVDLKDYKELNQYKWSAIHSFRNTYYAKRYIGKVAGKSKFITMHNQIMNPPKGFVVDHIDSVGTNNTRRNLRFATPAQNSYNARKTYRKTVSKYKGVCQDRRRPGTFRADISFQHKRRHLGSFNNEIDAARAYDTAAKKFFGQFAKLNLPNESG